MPSDGATAQAHRPSVFLSYASEDRDQAVLLRDAMAAAGLDVWFDANELGGGDAWDQKIRRQIRECDYFMPVISQHTEARHEGYFRREWRLAVERTMDMADDHPFLLPVVIDGVTQDAARVPEKFKAVQWVSVPSGAPNPALRALCERVVSGSFPADRGPSRPPILRRTTEAAPPEEARAAGHPFPEFPKEEANRRAHFVGQLIRWAVLTLVAALMRLPRWLRVILYLYCVLALVGKACSSRNRTADKAIPAETLARIEAATGKTGTASPSLPEVARLATRIAKDFAAEEEGKHHVLVLEFKGLGGTGPDASKAADLFLKVFASMSSKMSGQVVLGTEPPATLDAKEVAGIGASRKAAYVVAGSVDPSAAGAVLNLELVKVSDESVAWKASYPVAGADPLKIAGDVDTEVAGLEED